MDEEFHWEFSIPGEVCKIDPLGQMRWLKYKGQKIAVLLPDGRLIIETIDSRNTKAFALALAQGGP